MNTNKDGEANMEDDQDPLLRLVVSLDDLKGRTSPEQVGSSFDFAQFYPTATISALSIESTRLAVASMHFISIYSTIANCAALDSPLPTQQIY